MKREYKLFFRDIVSQTEKIQEFVGDKDFDTFKRDEKTLYAVCRSLEVIGGAVTAIPQDVKDAHPDIPWRNIKDFRNPRHPQVLEDRRRHRLGHHHERTRAAQGLHHPPPRKNP